MRWRNLLARRMRFAYPPYPSEACAVMHEVSRVDKPAGCIHQLLGHGSVRWMRFAYPPYPSEACAVMYEVSRVDKPAGRIHHTMRS